MNLTPNLEKVLMHYIFKNPLYFKQIPPHYFKNKDVQFVYETVQKSYQDSTDREMPGVVEIFDLVKQRDVKGEMSSDLIKTLLKVDLSAYRTETLEKMYSTVALSNSLKDGLIESIEALREIDVNDYASVLSAAAKIKEMVQSAATPTTGEKGIGSNFDDAESHNQDSYANKIPTGYKLMDRLMGGGWDRKTLNVLMGETNVGKSVWLQNIAKHAVNQGFNVAYLSLEMSEKKVMKRIGSMRMNINIAEYDDLSKDSSFMNEQLERMRLMHTKAEGLFEGRLGKFYCKEYPAGVATVDMFESYIKTWQEVTGEKLDMLVVDYIGIMGATGEAKDNLYQKGKQLAEGLRSLGQKYDLAVVTATQLSKDAWGGSDINLNSIPESKAIAETADSVWAIIRNPQMKIEGRYILKALKLRDSGFEYDRILFDLNKRNLNIENDRLPPVAA